MYLKWISVSMETINIWYNKRADGSQINVKHVKLGGWEQWLRTVSNAKANNIQIHIHKNRIYVNYITQKTQVIYTKSEGTRK